MRSRALVGRNVLCVIRITALATILSVWAVLPGLALASPGGMISGGGSASDMTRFALAITNGEGHFECLMPAMMTVEATVTGVDTMNTTAATFHGTAQVTLAKANPFGLPAGPMVKGQSFTASVRSGGPGVGFVDLEIMGMSFKGTVEHGQVTIGP